MEPVHDKEHVVSSVLAYYGLDKIKDPLERGMRAGWLLHDDRFLYPDPDVIPVMDFTEANGFCRYDDVGSFILELSQRWERSSSIDHMKSTG